MNKYEFVWWVGWQFYFFSNQQQQQRSTEELNGKLKKNWNIYDSKSWKMGTITKKTQKKQTYDQ